MTGRLPLIALLGLAGCAASTPEPAPRPARPRCDAFGGCPGGQRCLLGSCQPIDCAPTRGCTVLGQCSLQKDRCVVVTDADCRAAAVCRQLGLCHAAAGQCKQKVDVAPRCAHCKAGDLCICPLQRNLGQPDPPRGLTEATTRSLQQTINASMPQLQRCYEQSLQRHPELDAVRVVLDFTIDRAGQVSRARCAELTAPAVDLALCLLRHARTWKVDREPGPPVDIRYPLVFRVDS